MGYTSFTISKIEPLLTNVKSVIDLGAQNNYAQPDLPAPYISEWYKEKQIEYSCIDLNGENNAIPFDLSEKIAGGQFDLVVDAGTSEHIGKNGVFSWEAIYNCWLNKHNLLKMDGLMYNENPKTGNWPGHGFNYYTTKFYNQLQQSTDYDYRILDIGEHPAMGNTTDGWNVFTILKKKSEKFPSLEEFMKMDIRKS